MRKKQRVETVTTEILRTGWVVLVNSDLTEGRGRTVVLKVCELEATARRLARRANTQGTDGHVEPVSLLTWGGHVYGPVTVEGATREDRQAQGALDRRAEATQKARAAGLSEDDILAIQGRVSS